MPVEKLTNGTSITVRFTAQGFDTLDKIARRKGFLPMQPPAQRIRRVTTHDAVYVRCGTDF